jgi:hypothetical protein
MPGTLVASSTVRFPRTTVDGSSTKTVTISNRGLGVLHGTVGAVSGPFDLISGGGPFTLNRGQNIVVNLNFDPTATGPVQASMSLTSDDPKHQTATVRLLGTGK